MPVALDRSAAAHRDPHGNGAVEFSPAMAVATPREIGRPGPAPIAVIVVAETVTNPEPINQLLRQGTVVLLARRLELATSVLQRPADLDKGGRPGPAGPLQVDLHHHEMRWRGRRMNLTEHELGLLDVLGRRPGLAHSFQELATTVWRSEHPVAASVVHSTVHRLRRKLAAAGVTGLTLESVRGFGFRILADDEDASEGGGRHRPPPAAAGKGHRPPVEAADQSLGRQGGEDRPVRG
jgi:DNA-binding winged helix-turn-helix (wHTH) protein